jgi:single-strand DNA-binding protein
MYSGLNRVILFGRLGHDPETVKTESGKALLKLRLATRRSWPKADGGFEERTDWHRVTVWGDRAHNLARTLKKGDPLLIEGHLTYFEVAEGELGKTRHTAITADRVESLTRRHQPFTSPAPQPLDDSSLEEDDEPIEFLGRDVIHN